MNNGIELTDVTFFVNGEPIKTLNASLADIEYSTPPQDVVLEDGCNLSFKSKTYSGTFENVQISNEFKNMMFSASQRFKVIAESCSFPRGNRLPKKKRIRKKWLKKYYRKIELDNVEINPI